MRFPKLCLAVSWVLAVAGGVAGGQDVGELEALRKKIAEQERQIELLKEQLKEEKQLLEGLIAKAKPVVAEAAAPVVEPEKRHEETAPLSIPIGRVRLKVGGFLDLGFVARSRNLGSGVPTAFGLVPLGDTAQGQLSDVRFSAQNSRVTLGAEGTFAGADFKAYVESDFLGQAPPNLAVTTNGGSMRLRQYWVRLQGKKWEVLGGQAWSLATPNRVGVEPEPESVFLTVVEDPNYIAGLVWARDPQVRLVYRPNAHWTVAGSMESAEQFSGGEVALPAALVSSYGLQINAGSGNLSGPGLLPDFIGKVAWDGSVRGRTMHVEGMGMGRAFHVFNPLTGRHYTAAGFGASLNGNVEVVRNLRLVGNSFVSSGGGRYIFGLGPDLVVRANGSIAALRAYAALGGLEYTGASVGSVGASRTWFAYWGGSYFDRQTVVDADGSLIGFGYRGSGVNANRTVQQYTAGMNQVLWRSPLYGALRVLTQYSYVTRSPWWMAPGRPGSAGMQMVHLGLRFELP